MEFHRLPQRTRTLFGGKIVLNNKSSVINCTVRNLSREGACLQVENTMGVPSHFDLQVAGEASSRACQLVWQTGDRVGVLFTERARARPPQGVRQGNDHFRGDLLELRAALDEVNVGIVLLDTELRAQFINRTYRKMWRLSDLKADSKPAFVALMYHGRDTRAYQLPEADLNTYVAERVAQVKAGDPAPRDIRLANGEVIRFQCTVLPSGGRMLSYSYVTDIVRRSDELEVLRAALENINEGIILLDSNFRAQFMNRAVRKLWGITDEQAERKPSFSELVNDAHWTKAYDIPSDELAGYISRRIASVRSGEPSVIDLPVKGGRTIRSECTVLSGGGRMLTYTDITDLVRNAEKLERLATTDCMTGVYNRRRFLDLAEAEWHRFQRYHRSLSLLIFDVDNFKMINDRFGHEVGDRAIVHLCDIGRESKRKSDILARIGGDEFAILLPETDLARAQTMAERLREQVQATPLMMDSTNVAMTISIGVSEATLSQSGIDALLRTADQALYRAKSKGRNQTAFLTEGSTLRYKLAAE